MSQSKTEYLNGIFISKREGQYGEFLSIGITEEGLESLKNLAKNDKGVRNFTASPQRNDPNKFSSKPYVAKENTNLTKNTVSSGSDDTLPF
jgi:hypothetical protein